MSHLSLFTVGKKLKRCSVRTFKRLPIFDIFDIEWYLTVSKLLDPSSENHARCQWWTSDSLPLTLQSPPPFRYITFVYVLFFSTLRMAVQHLQGWTGEYLCLICWNQKQVSSSFCTDDNNIVISTEKKKIALNLYSFHYFFPLAYFNP